MRIIGFVLCWFSAFSFSQERKKTSISFVYQLAKVESFPSIQVNGQFWNAAIFDSSVGVGLRTTFLQGRLFPQFSAGLGYNVLHSMSKKLQLSPMVMSRLSGFRLSPQTRLNYIEGMGGYTLSYGERVILVHSAFFGKGVEWNQNNELLASFWTYSVNLGIGYVF